MYHDMMNNPFMLTIALVVLFCSEALAQQIQPYQPDQNVRADMKMAVEQAAKENKHVLVQFGGNWCPWCIRFHALVSGAPKVDSLVKTYYVYALANVPREKDLRDWDLFREYGYPNRFGFPVFVILDGSGNPLHIQDSGILEHCSAKGYDTARVVSFLKMWTFAAVDPATYQKK